MNPTDIVFSPAQISRVGTEYIKQRVANKGAGIPFGLDSIDAVELVFQLKKHFGVVIKNQSEGRSILQSVNTISAFIEKRQEA